MRVQRGKEAREKVDTGLGQGGKVEIGQGLCDRKIVEEATKKSLQEEEPTLENDRGKQLAGIDLRQAGNVEIARDMLDCDIVKEAKKKPFQKEESTTEKGRGKITSWNRLKIDQESRNRLRLM